MNAANTIDATRPKRSAVSPFGILLAFVILYNILPIVARLVSDYLSTYVYMVLVLFIYAVILLSRGLGGFWNCLIFLLPLILYQAFTYFFKNDSVIMWGYGVLTAILPMLLGYHFFKLKRGTADYPLLRIVLLLSILITILTTCIGLSIHPSASRILASIESSDSPLLRTYNYANIGGYDFVYTVVLLYPFLILAHKKKKIGRFVTILGMVAVFALSILSEYTTAFLFVLLTTLLLFFNQEKLTVKRIILLGFLGLILVFLLGSLFSRIFAWLADVINSESMAMRLRDLSKGWGGLSGSDDPRLPLYLQSLESFSRSPLFGRMLSGQGYFVGGHSFLLDSLGLYGLLGATFLFFMYRTIYRTFFKPYAKEPSFGYAFWAFLQTLLLSLLNTGMWLWVLCFFSPLLLSWIYQPAKEDTKEQAANERPTRTPPATDR